MFQRLMMVALLLFALPALALGELAEKDARKLITEYLDAATEKGRRAEIAQRLAGVNAELARKEVSAALKKDATRAAAIELARVVKLTGLLKEVKKYYDGSDRALITSWALEARDNEATLFLFQRFCEAKVDSDEFKELCEAFQKHYVAVEVLDKFLTKIKDATRGKATREILCWQFDHAVATAEDLEKNWQAYRAEYVRNSAVFIIKGINLMKEGRWEKAGVGELREHWSLAKSAQADLEALPDAGKGTPFSLTFRVALIEGEGAQVGLFTSLEAGARGFALEAKGDIWVNPTNPSLKVAIKRGEWQEVRYEVKAGWSVDIFVDGKTLFTGFPAGGEPKAVQFSSGGASMLIGGVDLKRARK